MAATTPTSLRDLAARYSPTQLRTLDVALELFARRGVGGTSLQMIADALGVTKAAVYHQFPTKEAIVLGVIEVKLQPIEVALEEAESAGGTSEARKVLLERFIDMVVRDRQVVTLQSDPMIVRLLAEHEASRHLWSRLYSVLLGGDSGRDARVRSAVLASAIGSVAHPFVADLDNDDLRASLVRITGPLAGLS